VLQEAPDKNEFVARHTRVAAMAELRCAIMRKLVRTAHYQTERNFSESLREVMNFFASRGYRFEIKIESYFSE